MKTISSCISRQYTVKSICSGAGGLEIGLEQAGLQVVESFEFWDKACDTLVNNGDHAVYKCDISRLMLNGQQKTDVIAATFPCTHFSTAGLKDGDELYLEAYRMILCLSPEVFIIENVPNMAKFEIVMEAFEKMPGYHVHTDFLNASDYGAPQNRKRLIITGTKSPFEWKHQKVSDDKKHYLRDILESNVDLPLSKGIVNRLNGVNKGQWPAHIYDPEKKDFGPTCLAHYGKDQGEQLTIDPGTKKIRPFTIREYARLQGFPDDYTFSGGKAASFTQIGNAVSPYMAKAIGDEIVRYFQELPAYDEKEYNYAFMAAM